MRRLRWFLAALLLAIGIAVTTASHPMCASLTPDDWFLWWWYGCDKDAAGGGGGGAG